MITFKDFHVGDTVYGWHYEYVDMGYWYPNPSTYIVDAVDEKYVTVTDVTSGRQQKFESVECINGDIDGDCFCEVLDSDTNDKKRDQLFSSEDARQESAEKRSLKIIIRHLLKTKEFSLEQLRTVSDYLASTPEKDIDDPEEDEIER